LDDDNPRQVLSMRNIFQVVHNAIDYPLRQFFRWQRKNFVLQNEEKTSLFSEFEPEPKAKLVGLAEYYNSQYQLSSLYSSSTRKNYLENLYYLEMLESALKVLEISFGTEIHAADIGVADWFYVRSLYALLKNFARNGDRSVILDGYEIDAFRVYSDAYSRIDHAMAYCRNLKNVSYIPKDFTPTEGFYDIIFLLFPFVLLENHLDWGLPINSFTPHQLVRDIWASIKEGGAVVIVNQGKEEQKKQIELLKEIRVPIYCSYEFKSNFYQYSFPRYVVSIIKTK
jgi:hypothetical protein